MLVNVSYRDKNLSLEIDKLVGKSIGFRKRIKMGGVGSPQLFVESASSEIAELFNLNNNRPYFNIELREKGVIIRFRSLLETFALVIPFYQLRLFKNGRSITLYGSKHWIRSTDVDSKVEKFIRRMLEVKNENLWFGFE